MARILQNAPEWELWEWEEKVGVGPMDVGGGENPHEGGSGINGRGGETWRTPWLTFALVLLENMYSLYFYQWNQIIPRKPVDTQLDLIIETLLVRFFQKL